MRAEQLKQFCGKKEERRSGDLRRKFNTSWFLIEQSPIDNPSTFPVGAWLFVQRIFPYYVNVRKTSIFKKAKQFQKFNLHNRGLPCVISADFQTDLPGLAPTCFLCNEPERSSNKQVPRPLVTASWQWQVICWLAKELKYKTRVPRCAHEVKIPVHHTDKVKHYAVCLWA